MECNIELLSRYSGMAALMAAEKTCLVDKKRLRKFSTVVFVWNNVPKHKHTIARSLYLSQVTKGKPKQGATYEAMKSSKAFKKAFRHRKNKTEQYKANALAEALRKDFSRKFFWSKAKQTNWKSLLPISMEGVRGM